MGYPIALSLLGPLAATSLLTFAIVPNFYIYTIGYWLLTKKPLSFKSLINPVMISLTLGVILGISGIPMPDFAKNLLETSSSCMAPTSMIMAGIVVSGFSFKTLLLKWNVYVITAFRLLIIPISVGFILNLVCPPSIVQTAVIYFSMPCGLNAVVFPRSIGQNCEAGASIAFISTLTSCLTIPLVFAIFGIGGAMI
jgi:predicted permease